MPIDTRTPDLFAEPPAPPRRARPPKKPRARARNTDPETSHAAARSVSLDTLWGKMLAALKAAGAEGLTSYEMAARTGIDRVSVSPQFRPMARLNYVRDSGVTRPGPSGREGIVWVLA